MRGFAQFGVLLPTISALRFDARYSDFNLNQNESASDPMDYWGTWQHHDYHPSPENWRFPFYSLMLDRFANGDASNDDVNGTVYETDVTNTHMRFGGDVLGLMDSLDYIQGMGIRGIYIVGSIFINLPWIADSYSPLDLTLLDPHFGTLSDWRRAIEEIHKRGMYVILDNTLNTLGDLLEYPDTANISTPFKASEWPVRYKTDRHYHDFKASNQYLAKCPWPLPRFWDDDGYFTPRNRLPLRQGCYNSEFDQYGNSDAFDRSIKIYERQLSKYSSAQDRLREWRPSVLQKIEHFSCLAIHMLDIDGYRIDKAIQVTVDAQAHFSKSIRECARKHGKHNFLISGEVVNEMGLSSVYFGRGRQPDMVPDSAESVLSAAADPTKTSYFLREDAALDGGVFHYGLYRALVIFLGIDGHLQLPSGSRLFNFVDMWQGPRGFLRTDDMVNANTGLFDPRHMWGVSNQDVFRWPSLVNGEQKMMLGLFIATFHFPGMPIVSWGEEQAFYIMDSTSANYLFGRQPMTSSMAWQMHGCSQLNSSLYYKMPFEAARIGCHDAGVSLDHRDPSHPIRNVLKVMNKRREEYPSLKDGWFLEQLSNHTRHEALPGSSNTSTEFGMWSTVRDEFAPFQNLSTPQTTNQPVWLLYHNEHHQARYFKGCVASPFLPGTTVKNLVSPYDEHTVDEFGKDEMSGASPRTRGCIRRVRLMPFEFKALVPKSSWLPPPPVITEFLPGHDARIETKACPGSADTLEISFSFSSLMNCTEIASLITFSSQTDHGVVPNIRSGSVRCATEPPTTMPWLTGQPVSIFTWKATLENIYPGVHTITIKNATTQDGLQYTDSSDRFLFRVGALDNPIVFPDLPTAMFPTDLLSRGDNGQLEVDLDAPGANKWRYSLNWGTSWSSWKSYSSGRHILQPQTQKTWAGMTGGGKSWRGEHVMVQYWSKIAGSGSAMQHADIESFDAQPRLFPHIFAHGDFNMHGHDRSMGSRVAFDGEWKFHFMGEWPDGFSLNVWGMSADGEQDLSFVYGDVDQNYVLERWIPSMLEDVGIPIIYPPKYPYLAYEFALQRDSYKYDLRPKGNRWHQILFFLAFILVPAASGITGFRIYQRHCCRIVLNRLGSSDNSNRTSPRNPLSSSSGQFKKRRVLIATMEYVIPDWNIDIRVGGLGTMSTLMGKHLTEYDLVWVIPWVGGITYPSGTPEQPILARVSGRTVQVRVFHHTLNNVTYVMLDSPIFRRQTNTQPYPKRMDDMQSAIYYSVWNSCIAEAIRRFSPDVYHINDYHGALAPLHLLPDTVPCALSLHNAEYQGLWPIRTPEEEAQVCAVFDISTETMKQYVQFGVVFNLLHAAVSYIRIHQNGFGAVGVSDVYSQRCMARYPVLWSLNSVGGLPNPDPSQLDHVQESSEKHEAKTKLKVLTQNWADLERDPSAELFIFVGRMSKQKGTDLIADVFPDVLRHNRKVQLLCIGPVVDMYGNLTAVKLRRIAEQFPRRVCCIPEFTQLPPFIFGGAEFVLIPSRDEPYGLVAAQFGRKGALAVGAEVGGLGTVPGWWYTVECTATRHLLSQLKSTVLLALKSSTEERDLMRTAALRQSFPISQWKARLEKLYDEISVNRRSRRALQRTWELSELIFRNIKEAVLPRKRYHVIRSLEDDGMADLESKLVAERMWANAETTSMDELVTDRDHCLNNVTATFTDEDGEVAATFNDMLHGLTTENSEKELCIQDFLISSEKAWYERIRNDQLGLPATPTSLLRWVRSNWWPEKRREYLGYRKFKPRRSNDLEKGLRALLEYWNDIDTVSRMQREVRPVVTFLAMKFHGYPLYTFALTLGQILSMNSLQLGILVGTISQEKSTLYTFGTIYATTSVLWWILYRLLPTARVLCIPFLLFGWSFLLLAALLLSGFSSTTGHLWELVQVLYLCGCSSGCIYFAMNFAEDEAPPIESWILRAAYISGSQYAYQSLLWYSASRVLRSIASTSRPFTTSTSRWFGALSLLIGLCLIAVYRSLMAGLPSLYRRVPGHVPKFYSSLLRRPVPIHYLFTTFIQSWIFSAPLMAQSWLFLFSSHHTPDIAIVLLIVAAIWGFMRLARIAATYSALHGHWILPVISFTSSCIIHPRWAQMFWAVSRLGLSLPWIQIPWVFEYQLQMVYSPFLSSVLSRSLWLYLGVFDLLIGIGNGLALMQTLPRQHALFVSMLAQVVGSVGMMAARATILAQEDGTAGLIDGLKALRKVFPDISRDPTGWIFWGVVLLQTSVALGWLRWFRGAQLQKP